MSVQEIYSRNREARPVQVASWKPLSMFTDRELNQGLSQEPSRLSFGEVVSWQAKFSMKNLFSILHFSG